MLPVRTQRPQNFWRQFNTHILHLLQSFRHAFTIVEDQQIGDQVVIFDDFQLLIPNILLNQV